MADVSAFDPCFPEPKASKRREPRRNSTPPEWLRTVDDPFARAMRHFLNENISQLPESFQEQMCKALKSRWDSAYFELIVARTLQLLGATIEAEPESEAGTRIDYHAQFGDAEISVEAIAPTFNSNVEEAEKVRQPLIDIVESLAPAGWTVFVHALPHIGPSDKKDELKRVLREMFMIAPPATLSEPPRELVRETTVGLIHLVLQPQRSGWPVIGGNSHFWVGDDSRERVRRSVRTKRKQAKNSPLPTILAIGAGTGGYGIFHADAVIDALYGERTAVLGVSDEMHHEFAPGGAFMKSSSDTPTYAGLLAFPLVGITRVDQPIFFHHPRYTGALPIALSVLEQYSFDPVARQIHMRDATHSDVLGGLNLVRDDVETP